MDSAWPALPLAAWQDTYATLHLWTQIVGKVRLVQTPWINHSWHVPLYVSARGLTTSPMPYGAHAFEMEFDFTAHRLEIRVDDGRTQTIFLRPVTVAAFYAEVMAALQALDLPVHIRTTPNEIADAIPFERDEQHRSYDADAAQRFWHALVQMQRVFTQFRARFVGKCSPVHFFWGSFDLAVTRFSGRTAPPHPGGVPNFPDWVAREAYSHEVSSCGFWPGGGPVPMPVFYSYAYPEPAGFKDVPVAPAEATYEKNLGEFVLPYDVVRTAPSPDETLLAFLQSTYEAAADRAGWDRKALERQSPVPPA